MTDRFDDAKRALEDVPAHDVWPEVERRADAGTVVALAAAPRRSRRAWTWVAMAAVVALVAGTAAVLLGDEQPVDTARRGDAPPNEVVLYEIEGGCRAAIIGEPLLDPEVTVTKDAPPPAAIVLQGALNPTQTYAVTVPSPVVRDFVGERLEDVELRRGLATLWFMPDGAVQLRWNGDAARPCGSYTVTVAGGTEDENRHAAVDLAERVDLSSSGSDPSPTPSVEGVWYLRAASKDGTTDPDLRPLRFVLEAGEISWSDGCKDFTGSYQRRTSSLSLEHVSASAGECLPTITSDAVASVMSSDVHVDFDGPLLLLSSDDSQLRLRPADVGADSTADSLAGRWRIVALTDGDEAIPVPEREEGVGVPEVEFGPAGLAWGDGCNGVGGDVEYTDAGYRVLQSATTLIGCEPHPGIDLINLVVGSSAEVTTQVEGDHLTIRRGMQAVGLERV